jgi:hypothetical protein
MSMFPFRVLLSLFATFSLDRHDIRAKVVMSSSVTTHARRSGPVATRNQGGASPFSSNRQRDIAADAERLIARFADQAYFEARDRVVGRCIDGGGSRKYWTRVKLEIARRQGLGIGLTGADAWA